jgi:hypothetical protein
LTLSTKDKALEREALTRLSEERANGGAGARAPVIRRQSDGPWLCLLDQRAFIAGAK